MNAEPPPIIDVQVATADENVPSEDTFRRWVDAALPPDLKHCELTIRVVGFEESRALNAQYRQKDKPTNVLSFPADIPVELEVPYLGDLVVCAPVVEQEAREQNKDLNAHWAHMIVHGTLHLLGFDHIEDAEADAMEALETQILTGLDFAPPYETQPEES